MMKSKWTFTLLFTAFFGLMSCSSKSQNTIAKNVDKENVLIVYLSRTNNTKAIAEIIQKNVGGKLVALELEKPYPENYKSIVDQVAKENETGYLPPLKTKIDSMEKYDIVFIGFPTWGMQLPPQAGLPHGKRIERVQSMFLIEVVLNIHNIDVWI